jgi:acyl-coenzyme A synthetase/AMP-(fatty) acid ligase
MDNWFDRIILHTRTQPETPALVMEDRVVTYGMLGTAIENCARRIVSADVEGSGVVAVLAQNPIRDLTLCLALFRIGIRSMSLERGQSGIAGLKFSAVLCDAKSKSPFGPAQRIVEVTDAWFAPEPLADDRLPAPFSDGGQVCREALTSGTTGTPKSIKTTVGYVGRYVGPGVMERSGDVVLCMLGLSSVWGYTIASAVLAGKRTLCFADSPYHATRMIELFSVDFVFASTDQVVALVRVVRKSGAQLRSLRTVVTGGSVPSRALLEAATMHLCKNVLCRYGTSELGSFAEATASEILAQPGLVGHLQPEYELVVFGSSGERCRPGEIGIVKGRIMPRGDGKPDDWIDHGDIGWVTPEGKLFVVGRTADIADLAGSAAREISPALEVEHLLRMEWDSVDAGAVMIDENSEKPEIWVGTVDCDDGRVDKLEAILRQKGIGGKVRLFALPFIPRGANGKVQRGQLKELILKTVQMTSRK